MVRALCFLQSPSLPPSAPTTGSEPQKLICGFNISSATCSGSSCNHGVHDYRCVGGICQRWLSDDQYYAKFTPVKSADTDGCPVTIKSQTRCAICNKTFHDHYQREDKEARYCYQPTCPERLCEVGFWKKPGMHGNWADPNGVYRDGRGGGTSGDCVPCGYGKYGTKKGGISEEDACAHCEDFEVSERGSPDRSSCVKSDTTRFLHDSSGVVLVSSSRLPQLEFNVSVMFTAGSFAAVQRQFTQAVAAALNDALSGRCASSCCRVRDDNVTIKMAESTQSCDKASMIASWPDIDSKNNLPVVCSECRVLVDNFDSKYGGRCRTYCESIGRSCVGAWEELSDTCDVKYASSCNDVIQSSDALCECGAVMGPTPMRLKMVAYFRRVELAEAIHQEWSSKVKFTEGVLQLYTSKHKDAINTHLTKAGLTNITSISAAVVKGFRLCPAGHTQNRSHSVRQCIPCAAGKFLGVQGSEAEAECEPCAAGKYSETFGAVDATTCLPCQSGTYATSAGSSVCSECPVDTFSSALGATSSEVCQGCPSLKSTAGLTARTNEKDCYLQETILITLLVVLGVLAGVVILVLHRRHHQSQINPEPEPQKDFWELVEERRLLAEKRCGVRKADFEIRHTHSIQRNRRFEERLNRTKKREDRMKASASGTQPGRTPLEKPNSTPRTPSDVEAGGGVEPMADCSGEENGTAGSFKKLAREVGLKARTVKWIVDWATNFGSGAPDKYQVKELHLGKSSDLVLKTFIGLEKKDMDLFQKDPLKALQSEWFPLGEPAPLAAQNAKPKATLVVMVILQMPYSVAGFDEEKQRCFKTAIASACSVSGISVSWSDVDIVHITEERRQHGRMTSFLERAGSVTHNLLVRQSTHGAVRQSTHDAIKVETEVIAADEDAQKEIEVALRHHFSDYFFGKALEGDFMGASLRAPISVSPPDKRTVYRDKVYRRAHRDLERRRDSGELSKEDFEAEEKCLIDEFEEREWRWWMAGANFDYVVYGTVGNPDDNLWVPPQVTQAFKDKKYHGGSISKDDYDTGDFDTPSVSRERWTLKNFFEHETSKLAELEEWEVAAVRLYTSDSFPLFNWPMRRREKPHPLKFTMYCLDEALNKLRRVEATRDIEEYNRVKYFWRGMKNMTVDVDKFFAEGGSELAPMSTTEDLNVAKGYAMSEMPLLFRFEARGRSKGVDIGFLSLYPREREVLYPALTGLILLQEHIVDEEDLQKLAVARGGGRKHSYTKSKVDDLVKDLNDRIAELQNEKEELLIQSRVAAASLTGTTNSQPRQRFRIYDVRPMK